MWRWASLVIALLALLSLFLMTRRGPPNQTADSAHSHTLAVSSTAPEKAVARANTSARRAQIHTSGGAPVVDELCGVKGADVKRGDNETFSQHVFRLTQPVISDWKSALAS